MLGFDASSPNDSRLLCLVKIGYASQMHQMIVTDESDTFSIWQI
jgi:hypothetical protein